MSSSAASILASPTPADHGNSPHFQSDQTFGRFFEIWIAEQNQHLQELISASSSTDDPTPEPDLRNLIDRVIRHHEQYYRTKSLSANRDVLAMLHPSWRSSLEDAFLWIGGWRPSMAFHLLLSKSGIQLEVKTENLLSNLRSTTDLGGLSPSQLSRADDLQRRTIIEEKALSEALAAHQESVADSSMVELSHIVTALELARPGSGDADDEVAQREREGDLEERIGTVLERKENGLKEILHKADDLRLKTLKEVVDLLTPTQAVQFLIAAAELHLRVHEWGKKRDETRPRTTTSRRTDASQRALAQTQ